MREEMVSNVNHMTIKDAAKLLGVCIHTLRNWDNKGLFKPYRHPINNYRYYRKKDLDNLLAKITFQQKD